jgi:hypothetical protein
MFGLDYAKIAVLVITAAAGAFVAHKLDLGKINHLKTEIVQLKLDHEVAVRKALEWATAKQKDYDREAIAAAQNDARRQSDLAADANERVRALASIPPRVLVRGCLTYEFVRQLDAAIVASGAASALPLPAGKSADACAPVDAPHVVQWLLGIVDTAKRNGAQLDGLIAFFRAAQAQR